MKNKIGGLVEWLVIVIGLIVWALIAASFKWAPYLLLTSVLATVVLCVLATVSKKRVRS